MNGRVFSYSRALRGGNTGLRKEGEREVHMCTVRHNSDVVVATTLRGGDAEGICPYAGGEEVSWTGGWLVVATRCAWAWQCTLHRRTMGRLCLSLDGALSAPAVGSVKQPARDLITERLAPASGRRSVEQGGA
jgi:hypothetical protein